MQVIKTGKDGSQAYCHNCDCHVRACVDVSSNPQAFQNWLCTDCMVDGLNDLLKAGDFFDHFSTIRELADKLSMELGQLQQNLPIQAESEAAYVMSILAHNIGELAGSSAHIVNGLNAEVGVRKRRNG